MVIHSSDASVAASVLFCAPCSKRDGWRNISFGDRGSL